PATATLQYTINGVSAQKTIMRQSFGGGVAPMNVSDLWYRASENGWGINIAQHGDTLFAVWYTYGSDGKTRWLVMPGGSWAGNAYSGALYKTVSSPWLGVPYNPAQLQVTQVGTLTLTFGDIVNGVANSATMRYTVDDGNSVVDQTKSITRQPY
ncbi:MAG: hypothetical protein JNM52_09370, partial [Betaproteobacteria bacterium]|nr:hypothetical protein [Betaproteobacteria bacterium]